MDIATLGLKVDASGAITATNQLDGSLKKLGGTSSTIEASLKRLGGALGVAFGARELIKTADTFTLLGARLRLVTTGTAELAAAQSRLVEISQQNRTSIESTATLYTRLAVAGQSLGISSSRLLDVTEAVNAAILVSGATATEATAAIIQLSQGIGAGVLRGEELNSVLEQTPRVAQAIAAGLDVPIGKLRELGAAGELTSEKVIGALERQLPILRREAAGIPTTVGQALVQFNNAVGLVVSGTNDAVGATVLLAGAISRLSTFMADNQTTVQALVVALGTGGLVAAATKAAAALALVASTGTLGAFIALAGQVRNLSAALALAQIAAGGLWKALLGPIGIGLAVVTAVTGAFVLWKNRAKEATDETTALANATRNLPTPPSVLAADSGVQQAAAERIRQAQQELILAGQTADQAAITAITQKAVNDTLKAQAELKGRDLALTTAAIETERRFAIAAERSRQVRAATQDTQDRVRQARQAIDLVNAEGEAAALLQVEQKAVNATIEARTRLSGENLAIVLRGIALEKELGAVLVQQAAIRDRSRAREAQGGRIAELQGETDALRQQVAALNQSAEAYRAVVLQQRIAAAIAKEEAAAKAANIALTDAQRAAIADAITEYERLARILAALQSLNGQNPFVIPDQQEVGAFADGLAQALSSAQGIVAVFGGMNRELGAAIGQAAQLATSVARLQQAGATKNGAGNAIGIGGALSGAGGAATAGAAISGALGVVGATVAIADAFDLFGTRARARARELAEAARQFNEALDDFAIQSVTALEGAIKANLKRANDLVREAAAATGINLNTQNFGSAADIEAFVETLRSLTSRSAEATRLFKPFLAELDKLVVITKANEAAIKAANKAREAAALEDLEVRRLAAQGLDAAAEAERRRLAGLREIAEAEKTFGAGSPYVDALREVVAAEEAAAAAALARTEAQEAEDRRRQRESFGIRALAVTDPAAARDARFYADQAAEMFDAIQEGLDDATIDALAFAQSLEAAAFEIAKIEDALRAFEGLFERGLRATGQTARADLFGLDASQRQEMTDAIAEGMSETNLALLEFVQFAEREQFLLVQAIAEQTAVIQASADREIAAIDEQIGVIRMMASQTITRLRDQIEVIREGNAEAQAGYRAQIEAIQENTKAQTDAIDEQIRVARDAIQRDREALAIAQRQLGELQKASDALSKLRDDLTVGEFSPLSPEAQLREQRNRFETLAAQAAGGDATAGAALPAAATDLLRASRGFFASGPGFVEDFNRVQSIVSTLANRFAGEADAQTRIVQAAERSLAANERTVQNLQATKDAIVRTSQAEIAVIQSAADLAAKQANTSIEQLQEQIDETQKNAETSIERLTELRDAVIQNAEDQIALITEQLTAISVALIGALQYYAGLEQPSSGAWEEQYEIAEEAKTAAMQTVVEVRRVADEVRTGLAAVVEEATRARNVAVAASTTETRIGETTNTLLRELVSQQRLAASAPTGSLTVVQRA